MSVWNVAVPVVALVEAESEEQALKRTIIALSRAGFDIYHGDVGGGGDAFESEPGTEPNLYVPVTVQAVPAVEYYQREETGKWATR